MAARKHFKQLVRARMQKTGESYAAARRQVIGQAQHREGEPAAPWHFPGSIALTTALRVLLANAGVRAPHTGAPYSEAMLFGIAGGIGAGVFSFLYEKENFASFFLAGRHSWQDDFAYLRQACERFDIEPVVNETVSARAAEKALRAALAQYGPCIAWVDLTHLPYRAMLAEGIGSGYHVITIYGVDDEQGTALIGDLSDEPLSISLADLAAARARIKKQKNRLLSIPTSVSSKDLATLVREGLEACQRGLVNQRMKNFTLDAFRVWAERMHGSKDKESWERIFTRGPRLWRGLTSIYIFIEYYGTGGGLCRPIFADFLTEAAGALDKPALSSLSKRYADLGRGWSELADAALPDDVPLFRKAKALYERKAELTLGAGPPAVEEIRGIWAKLAELECQSADQFPLSEAECAELRANLQPRIMALYQGEVAAHAALEAAIASYG